jgi:uncharacterized membrane protein HdeD (DUF308 family)
MPLAGLLRSSLDYWWVLVVRGALAVLFGVLALAWPHITVVVLIALFAAFAFLDGISSIISAAQRRDFGWTFIGGILSVILGVMAVLWPVSAGFALVLLIGAWALVRGVFDIAAAFAMRHELASGFEWMLVISGIVSIIFGLFVLLFPLAGAFAIVGVVAGFAIFLGVTLIAAGLRQRALRNRLAASHA